MKDTNELLAFLNITVLRDGMPCNLVTGISEKHTAPIFRVTTSLKMEAVYISETLVT
jgi:hypothetical protein